MREQLFRMRAQLFDISDELSEAKKDTARLDWLERPQQITLYVNPSKDVAHLPNSGQTFREAIDAAMAASK